MRKLTEMFKNISENTRNPARWCHIKARAILWTDKPFIQSNIDLMVAYIERLEESNKDLVAKNNDLLSKQTKIEETING